MARYSWANSILRDYDNHKRWALSYQGKQLARTVELLVATSLEWARPVSLSHYEHEYGFLWVPMKMSSVKMLWIVSDWVSCASQNLFLLRMAGAIHISVLCMDCMDKVARTRSTKVWSCNGLLLDTDVKSRIEHELELLWLGFLLSQNGRLRECLTISKVKMSHLWWMNEVQ